MFVNVKAKQELYSWSYLSGLTFLFTFCLFDFSVVYITVVLKLYLFYNNYKTNYTTYINHARCYRCLRSDGLRVGGNRSTRRKPTCLTWWPHDHLTFRRRVSNTGRSDERRVCYHCASQTDIVTLKQSTMYAYCRVIHFHFSDDDSTQNHWSEHKIERHKSDSCHMYTVCWLNTEKWNCYVLISCNL